MKQQCLNEPEADIATLSAFGQASQLNRLLRLDFRFNDGPKNGVHLVSTMLVREELSRDFRVDLELLSDNAFMSFDYKKPRPQRVLGKSTNRQGDVYSRERSRNIGSYGLTNRAGGNAFVARGIQVPHRMTLFFQAEGNDRNAQAARRVRMQGPFSNARPRMSTVTRDDLIIAIDHYASNNYQVGPAATPHNRNEISCVRQSVFWRPGIGFNSHRRHAPGLQTTPVAGPPGQQMYTDALRRIKRKFQWYSAGKYANASSLWMRMAMPVAGGDYGQIGLTRVRQEIPVRFMDGDVRHPIVTGVVYNSAQMPQVASTTASSRAMDSQAWPTYRWELRQSATAWIRSTSGIKANYFGQASAWPSSEAGIAAAANTPTPIEQNAGLLGDARTAADIRNSTAGRFSAIAQAATRAASAVQALPKNGAQALLALLGRSTPGSVADKFAGGATAFKASGAGSAGTPAAAVASPLGVPRSLPRIGAEVAPAPVQQSVR